VTSSVSLFIMVGSCLECADVIKGNTREVASMGLYILHRNVMKELIIRITKSRIGKDIGTSPCGPTSTGVGFLPNSENIFSYFCDVSCYLAGAKCFCGCKIIIGGECLPS